MVLENVNLFKTIYTFKVDPPPKKKVAGGITNFFLILKMGSYFLQITHKISLLDLQLKVLFWPSEAGRCKYFLSQEENFYHKN